MTEPEQTPDGEFDEIDVTEDEFDAMLAESEPAQMMINRRYDADDGYREGVDVDGAAPRPAI